MDQVASRDRNTSPHVPIGKMQCTVKNTCPNCKLKRFELLSGTTNKASQTLNTWETSWFSKMVPFRSMWKQIFNGRNLGAVHVLIDRYSFGSDILSLPPIHARHAPYPFYPAVYCFRNREIQTVLILVMLIGWYDARTSLFYVFLAEFECQTS